MQTFISETIQKISEATSSYKDVVFILPSQRAGVFVKSEMKNNGVTGFLPQILNIEQFVSEVSGFAKADAIELLFYFYNIYKKMEEKPDSFDVFSSWAFTVIKDFSEIDQHLVNTKDILTYIRDINRLKKWSVNGTFKETDLIKDHHAFTEKLNEYYDAFYAFLSERKIGYQGVLYREAVKNLDSYLKENKDVNFFFIGFNALNQAEETIFQRFLLEGNTEVFWDIDEAFLNTKHQAGTFIRRYKEQWKYYQRHELKPSGSFFSNQKKIELVGASKNITQIKYAAEVLSSFKSHQNTALVLADETLLPITLNSLPKNVNAVNITMGYPLKDIPLTSLFFAIFRLFISQEKLNNTQQNLFYHKDVQRLLKEASIYKLLVNGHQSISDQILTEISKENRMFVNHDFVISHTLDLSEDVRGIIAMLFGKFKNINEFLNRIVSLIHILKEDSNELEQEYLYRFNSVFKQLQVLNSKFGYFSDLKTLYQFFKQLISSETLSFQGEPLQGLQLMGMLETRVVDFKNVILTSVNENVLPANAQQTSFIPFDVKVEFNIPTYREKDAIFAYHFFRLIQRAENICLIYNTENDNVGGGEKSRFITQLEMMKHEISSKIVSPKIVTQANSTKEVIKNDLVFQQLKELAQKGISPSAIATYLYNPIQFYKQKVLRIREFDEVEEEIAFNTLGTVVHDTLEALYEPYLGSFLTVQSIKEMQSKIKDLINKFFKAHFKNGDLSTGKNRLIYEVAIRFVENFIKKEKELVSNSDNQLKIIATEENLSAEINIEGIPFPIKIHGQVDRVDELNGVLRIIDYKTGMVKSTDLKISDFSTMKDYKYSKAIQVMLYTYLYINSKNISENKVVEAGIYSFKNLNSEFLKMNFSNEYRKVDSEVSKDRLEDFMVSFKELLLEIYNKENSFKEPLELAF